jgi:hypothetical protein
MLRQFLLSRFFSKLFYELLPAAIVSGVGGMLFNHYVSPFSHYANPPIATPAAAIESPVNAEMIQMVRDEHGLIVDYLKRYTEARQQADRAAEQEARRIKPAERPAMARPAETRAVAVVTHITEKPETKVPTRQPAQHPDKAEPLRMASLAPQVQSVVQPAMPPVRLVTPAADSDENIVKTKLHVVAATVERIPFLGSSVAEWLSGDGPPRPLPPVGPPPSNWP